MLYDRFCLKASIYRLETDECYSMEICNFSEFNNLSAGTFPVLSTR